MKVNRHVKTHGRHCDVGSHEIVAKGLLCVSVKRESENSVVLIHHQIQLISFWQMSVTISVLLFHAKKELDCNSWI